MSGRVLERYSRSQDCWRGQPGGEDSEVMSNELRYKKKLLRCVGVSRSMS